MNVTPLSASHELEAGDGPASGSGLHGMGVALCSSVEGAAVILITTDTPLLLSVAPVRKVSFQHPHTRLRLFWLHFLLDICDFLLLFQICFESHPVPPFKFSRSLLNLCPSSDFILKST